MSERHRPFSSGSEYSDWTYRNCKAGCRRYTMGEATCDLEIALGRAYMGDGTISPSIAKRLGCDRSELGYPATPCPEFVTFTTRAGERERDAR
jgi:hypothetical protein